MDRQLYIVWGEMDELGSIVKGLLFLSICRKETRRERPFFCFEEDAKRSKEVGWDGNSCQLSIILLVDSLMEILVVASGYCAVWLVRWFPMSIVFKFGQARTFLKHTCYPNRKKSLHLGYVSWRCQLSTKCLFILCRIFLVPTTWFAVLFRASEHAGCREASRL